jgi:hypothetical protein
MDTIVRLLQSLPEILGPVLSTLFGLIAIDLVLGVAVALRKGVFQWVKVTEFYKTNVLPYGLTALVVAAAAQFISADLLGDGLAGPIADLGVLIGVGPMFTHLVMGSIIPNVKALVLGKFRWQLEYPALDTAGDTVDGAGVLPDPGPAAVADGFAYEGGAMVAASPEEGGRPVGDNDLPDVQVPAEDVAALNSDGTAVDHYDPETLNHVGSESILPQPGDADYHLPT